MRINPQYIRKIPQNITRNVKNFTKDPLYYMANCKLQNKTNMSAQCSPAKTGAAFALASIVLKDAIGCFYYVKQSMTNKKIPDDKRGFVAALDLANGFFNISLQLLMGKLVMTSKTVDKLFNKCIGTVSGEETQKKVIDLVEQNYKKVSFSKKTEAAKKALSVIQAPARNMFGLFATLIVTSVITKRVIVPLVSTPTAGVLEKKYFSKTKDKEGAKEIKKAASGEKYRRVIPWKKSTNFTMNYDKNIFEQFEKLQNKNS